MGIYINGAAHISLQNPLCDDWISSPILCNQLYTRAQDPDFKLYINPMAARRMSPIVKRSVVTSRVALQNAEVEVPDAIIVGTGLGCIDNTEKFLDAMVREGEQFLKPTYFIQSTHNTVASQIAIDINCHGYNSTYVHLGISFESALLDAIVQFRLGKIHNALVGGHDEMTPQYVKFLGKINYWKKDLEDLHGALAGEGSTSFVLSDSRTNNSAAEIKDIQMLYKADKQQVVASMKSVLNNNGLSFDDVDMLLFGFNDDCDDDSVYQNVYEELKKETQPIAVLSYKQLSGEYFTSSAFGLYVASTILKNRTVPMHLIKNNTQLTAKKEIRNILIYNHWHNINHSITLITSC